ncbi:MAG TPA: ATP-binding protein [Spirochaetota bacterium]|nr:ATP-binding protein [Spirochaetota bacterium]
MNKSNLTNDINFFANLTHELRSPLNSIIGFATLLYEEENDSAKKDKIEIIKNASNYLLNLVNDILDLSKMEAGKLTIEKIDFLLLNLLKHIQNLFSVIAKSKDINFILEIDSSVPNLVLGDEMRISQILINIVSNALKFTDRNGKVTLKASYQSGKARFEIIDNGIGIPDDKINQIFEPFEQVDSSMARKYGGSGLGLTVTKDLINLMGGEITIKSKLKQGTSFTIEIPLECVDTTNIKKGQDMVEGWIKKISLDAKFNYIIFHGIKKLPERISALEEAVLSKNIEEIKNLSHQFKGFTGSYGMEEIYQIAIKIDSEAKEDNLDLDIINSYLDEVKEIINLIPKNYFNDENVEKKLQKKKLTGDFEILLAEDNEDNQKLILAYCESINVKCDIAGNGVEVLKKMRKTNYKIVFLDLEMPIMNGITTIKKIRASKKLNKAYVIGLTASATLQTKKIMIEAGCDDFMTKPIDRELFENKILDLV